MPPAFFVQNLNIMKTFYLATVMLICTFAATAQTEKRTVNINGLFGSNGGGVYQSNDAANDFKLNLGVGTGYFIKNNWEIGAGIQFGATRTKSKPPYNTVPGITEQNALYKYNLNLYSKYYFGTGSVKPFAVVSTGYNLVYSKQKTAGNEFKGNSNYFNSGGGAGLAWFPSRKVGLFTQLTYDHIYNDQLDQGSFNLNFGVQINLGKK